VHRKDRLSLNIFPLNSEVNRRGHLVVGDCDVLDLVGEFGTPLYVLDEKTIRFKCREFRNEFISRYPEAFVIYASKAFLIARLAALLKEEGIGLDVVSGGELTIAQSVAFPPEMIYFHGNNKTADELRLALKMGIGRIVVDNLHEIDLLNRLAKEKGTIQAILIRINPGVDPHTHRHTTTGVIDSKFGFSIQTGQAESAVASASAASHLDLVGLHFHLGSPIHEISPYELAVEKTLDFAREMKKRYAFDIKEFSPGGGFAVQYTRTETVPCVSDYAEMITTKIMSTSVKMGFKNPKCIVEPGRGIIAQAGVALYKVGSIKEIPEIRTYVAVDGGIGDNIRPALYDAKYEAVVANKMDEKEATKVTIAGRYCESGDILVKDIMVPYLAPDDIIAIPVSGAYSIPMSSNYNAFPRPAIVMVKDGECRLIRRRESYHDLISLDSD